jgi:glycosyltransferase involved in cell wall biosynthesis
MAKKLLFVHDGPRWKDNKGNQYGNSSDIDIFQRYKYLADEVSFCMRVFLTDKLENLTDLNEQGLFINEIAAFNRPTKLHNFFKSRQKIQTYVDQADLIIVRLPSTIGSIAYWAAKRNNIPVLVEVVACPFDSLSNHSLLGKIYARFSVKKLRRIMLDSKFSIYVTSHFLQSRYPTNGSSLAISDVVLSKSLDKNQKSNSYSQIEVKNRTWIITTAGVVNLSYKGHYYVLKAISILIERGYSFEYNIVGGGDNSSLKVIVGKLQINEYIKFLGKIPHKDIFKVLGKTDIYIQPSETEGMPRALIEAMSCGCACLGSTAGGIPELLNSDFLFESKNVNDLVIKIKKITSSNYILVDESQRNFEKAKQFKFEVLESKRKSFYDKFINSINEK